MTTTRIHKHRPIHACIFATQCLPSFLLREDQPNEPDCPQAPKLLEDQGETNTLPFVTKESICHSVEDS